MYKQVEKSKEKQRRVLGNALIQEKSDRLQDFEIQDNRANIKTHKNILGTQKIKQMFLPRIGSEVLLRRHVNESENRLINHNIVQRGSMGSKKNDDSSGHLQLDYVVAPNAILKNDILRQSVAEAHDGWNLYDCNGNYVDYLYININKIGSNWTLDTIYAGMGRKLGAAVTYLELLKDKYSDENAIDGSPNTNPGSFPLFQSLGIDDPKVSSIGNVRNKAEEIMHSKGWYVII
jgi:hypothetical protein